ncbi:Intradiol ring-cleavage dioxygenase [Amylocarpus encephaloides]|uniref:Intradiol ring-cleavage dioxygenase n=1 Tax=Amylocarpus encephaloides TaxID=45428 RepID=A0A9P8C128_9HELO|nr:Intradiol ring-cleavage dioxygenase [Amylocarpus encephaloides]
MQLITSIVAALVAGAAVAHPGHDHSKEIAERAEFMKHSKKDLSHCAAKMKARGLEANAIARRNAKAQQARKKRNIAANAPFIQARDTASVIATSHLSSVDYDASADASVLFSSNSTCVLSPEVTQGPYYVEGEYVREDMTEDQEGVDLVLDTQVIDVATCDPVTNAMVEIWHCNSTGVYSGIVASGNGDSSDLTNINATFLRALQPTDEEGVAQFTTLFPGHYTSRATHIHVLAHFNGTTHDNGTYSGGHVSHVGQVFFDQGLITQVEAVAPYRTNTQEITANADDAILSDEAAATDPVVEYSLLGDDIRAGVFGWIAFGVDLTSEQILSGAASLTASGGVEHAGSGMGGGPGGNGTAPTGAAPSGAVPSGAVSSGAVPSGAATSGFSTSAPSSSAVGTTEEAAVAESSPTASSAIAEAAQSGAPGAPAPGAGGHGGPGGAAPEQKGATSECAA